MFIKEYLIDNAKRGHKPNSYEGLWLLLGFNNPMYNPENVSIKYFITNNI